MEEIITQTKNWIKTVVVGCNFCPFAAKEMKQGTIHYQVESSATLAGGRQRLLQECKRLDKDPSIATTLLIFPHAFPLFTEYLDLVSSAEKLMQQRGYNGIYQLASFHPLYQFAGTEPEDAVNYTNRSIYPMLHLLREEQISKALLHYPDPARIPENNIRFAREKGAAYMKMLRDSCL